MKKNDLKQITALSVKELTEKAGGLRKEIADLTMEKNMKKLKNTRSISKTRKDLAQVLTFRQQKKLIEELEKKEAKI